MSILDKVNEMIHPGTSNFKALLLASVNQFGGISGLLIKFKEKGLGNIAQSWTQGKDLDKLTTDHVEQVFGFDAIKNIAEKTGVQPRAVTEQISKFLPMLVHQLSPNGQAPEGLVNEEQISAGVLDRFKGMFKKSA